MYNVIVLKGGAILKVLIVDDSKMNIKVAEDTLKEYHIVDHIITCLSAEEALTLLTQQTIDLILLDIVMPNMTGVELLKTLQEKNRLESTKVIMLTTVDDFMVLKECFELGATDYINKPFNKIEFTARVKSALSEIESEKKLMRALELMERQNVELIRVNKMLSEAQAFVIEKERMTAIGELVEGLTKDIKEPLVSAELEVDRVMKKIDTMEADMPSNVLINVKTNIGEGLSSAQNQLKKIDKLFASLRNMSKDHRVEERVPARLSDMLEETLMILGQDLKRVEKIEKTYGDPSLIICNKGLVKKAMLHCLQNALYAMKDIPHSKLVLKTVENDKSIVCIIEDNGTGIDKAIQNAVFEPFFTTKPKKEHMGVGLSIVNEVVCNVHGGKIELDSEVDSGTKISMRFNK